jgi:hypothetical protein
MTTIYKLDTDDIKKLIANKYNVGIDKVSVSGGYDAGDGPYPGRGAWCRAEVIVNECSAEEKEN